jgi:hypothetical protein
MDRPVSRIFGLLEDTLQRFHFSAYRLIGTLSLA